MLPILAGGCSMVGTCTVPKPSVSFVLEQVYYGSFGSEYLVAINEDCLGQFEHCLKTAW